MTTTAFGLDDIALARRVAVSVLGIADPGTPVLHATHRGVPVELRLFEVPWRRGSVAAARVRCEIAVPAHCGFLTLHLQHGGASHLTPLARPLPPALEKYRVFVEPPELGPELCDDAVLERLAWLEQQNPDGLYRFHSDGPRLVLTLACTADPDALRTALDTMALASGNVLRGLDRMRARGVDLAAFERHREEQAGARRRLALRAVAVVVALCAIVSLCGLGALAFVMSR